MRVVFIVAICSLPAAVPLAAQPGQPLLTWAYVEAVDGSNVLLDSGTILHVGDQTAIRRADGSTGGPDDLERHAKIVFPAPGDGAVESIQVFPARGPREVYLYDLPVERGGANGTAVPVDGRLWPKCIATTGAAYQRDKYSQRFEASVLYQPAQAADAPAKALFAVLDELGTPLHEVAVSAGQRARIALGFGTRTTQRITLHARAVGNGRLRQEWCLWLDPHLMGSAPPTVRWTASSDTLAALMDRLGPAIAGERAGKVAVAMFYAARGFDTYALSDLQNDLFVATGQSGSVAGKYSGRPMIGAPLSAKDRDQLKKLGATSVILGSVSLRTEGYIVNAALVDVASGAILTTATARQ